MIGAGSVNPTTNVGRLVMTLKPRGERRDDVSVVVARLKQLTASIPGMTIYFQPVQDVQISTQSSRSQYQYTLTGTDAAQVALWANNLVAELRRDPCSATCLRKPRMADCARRSTSIASAPASSASACRLSPTR